MAKKKVHTIAPAEKIASGGDCYIILWTADAKVWVKNGGCVRRRMRSVEAAGKERCRGKQLATFKARGASPRKMRASGSCYKKSIHTGRRIDTCDSSRWRRQAGREHSGIKMSVINFARRKSCGKQREIKKRKASGKKRIMTFTYSTSRDSSRPLKHIKQTTGDKTWH
jgi:hypothetical protein